MPRKKKVRAKRSAPKKKASKRKTARRPVKRRTTKKRPAKKKGPKKRRRRVVLPADVSENLERIGGYGQLLECVPKKVILDMVSQYHHAMSDPIRLRILWALSATQLCPSLLKKIAQVSDSKLSYHLRILEKAELIRSNRSKNWRVYSITEDGLASLGKL